MSATTRLILCGASFFFCAILCGVMGMTLLGVDGSYTPQLDLPQEDSSFVYTTGYEMSHLMLFHNLRGHIEQARKADVLILGDSRSQLGFMPSVLIAGMKKLGLSVFWLSTGYGEAYTFYEKIIKKYDLKDKIIILQDAILTRDDMSISARSAVNTTWWAGVKTFYEAQISWIIQRYLHSVFPKLSVSSPWISGHVLYRNNETGAWFDCQLKQREKCFPVVKETNSIHMTEKAMEFVQYLKNNGNTLVLVTIPDSIDTAVQSASKIADTIDVSYISPKERDFFTYDKTHLQYESAETYTKDFLDVFLSLFSSHLIVMNK